MKVLVACESNKSSSCFHYLCLLMGILGRQVSFVEFKEINYRCFWYLVFWAFVLIFLFHVLEDGVSSLKFFFFPPNKGKKKEPNILILYLGICSPLMALSCFILLTPYFIHLLLKKNT